MGNGNFEPVVSRTELDYTIGLACLPAIRDPALLSAAQARLSCSQQSCDTKGVAAGIEQRRFQQLEKRGDSVIKYLANRVLYERGTTAAEQTPHFITVCESYLVSNALLSQLARGYELACVPNDATPVRSTDESGEAAALQQKGLADIFEAHLGALDAEGRMSEMLRWASPVLGHLFDLIRVQALAHVRQKAIAPPAVMPAAPSATHGTQVSDATERQPKQSLNEIARRHRYSVEYRNRKFCVLLRDGEEWEAASVVIDHCLNGKEAELVLAKEALDRAIARWPEEKTVLSQTRAKRRKMR